MTPAARKQLGGNCDLAATLRHRVKRVRAKVEDDLQKLIRVNEELQSSFWKERFDRDVNGSTAAEQAQPVLYQCVQIDFAFLSRLLAAEGQDLVDQFARLETRRQDLMEIFV